MSTTLLDTAARAAACTTLAELSEAVVGCAACPRLRQHCAVVAESRVRRHADETYWGLPVPGFGDAAARLLIVGLAPAAHGANRTGRMFTGDRSGDFLYAALHRAGLASQPTSVRRGDGLSLRGVYISAAARCAPPGNKPTPEELRACRPYLLRELALLPELRVVLALGQIGHDAYLAALAGRGLVVPRAALRFGHGAEHRIAGTPLLVDSYHVSQQNTFTGRLTPPAFDAVLQRARELGGLG